MFLDKPYQGFMARAGGEIMMAAAAFAYRGRRLHTIEARIPNWVGSATGIHRIETAYYRGSGIFFAQGLAARMIRNTDGTIATNWPSLDFTIAYSRTGAVFFTSLVNNFNMNQAYNFLEGAPFLNPNEGFTFDVNHLSGGNTRRFEASIMGIEFI